MFMSNSMKSTLMQLIAPALAGLVPPMPLGFTVPSILIDYDKEEDYYTIIGFDPGKYTVTILDGTNDCPSEANETGDDNDWYKTKHGHGPETVIVKIRDIDGDIEVLTESPLIVELYCAVDSGTTSLDCDDLFNEIEAMYKGEERSLAYLDGQMYQKLEI